MARIISSASIQEDPQHELRQLFDQTALPSERINTKAHGVDRAEEVKRFIRTLLRRQGLGEHRGLPDLAQHIAKHACQEDTVAKAIYEDLRHMIEGKKEERKNKRVAEMYIAEMTANFAYPENIPEDEHCRKACIAFLTDPKQSLALRYKRIHSTPDENSALAR